MTSLSMFAFALLFFGLSHSSPIPLNVAGTPNTACSTGTIPSMNYVKAVTCLMESDVINYMRDPSILSFDVFREDNWNSNSFIHDTTSCNCIYPTLDTNQYISDPVYNVDPHVTVRYLYDPRIPYASQPGLFYQQELPENIQSNSVSTPVNTAWLLQDHINSLRGFINYFVPAKSVQGGQQVALAALALNSTILPELDFQFSNQCPADNRVANFTGFPSSSCEFKCAVWHFNWTINGLYYALANHVIYPPATPVTQPSDSYPEKEEWVNKDCCSLPPINPVTTSEYRQLTCAISVLTYEAYNLFELLGSQASVECSGVATVTGINVWTNYIQKRKFPPLSWSQSDNLYIYTNHFDALLKQAQDLVNLTTSTGLSCLSEFPGYQEKLNYTIDLFEFIFPLGEKWLKAHGCPSCSKCTVKDPHAVPRATPINPYLNCTDVHQQVSCLVLDIQRVADSFYLYLDMRDEASATWGKECAPWSFF